MNNLPENTVNQPSFKYYVSILPFNYVDDNSTDYYTSVCHVHKINSGYRPAVYKKL